MTSQRQKVALVVALAAFALIAGGTAWAGPAQQQQERQAAKQAKFVFETTGSQEAEARVAPRVRQEIRVRPTIRIPSAWNFRSSNVASTVLAHAEELELSDEQAASIRELQRAARRAGIRRDADMEIAELDLEDMMAGDARDLNMIEAKLRELAELRVDDQMEDLRLEQSVLAALTDAQRDQVEELSPGRLLIERMRRR